MDEIASVTAKLDGSAIGQSPVPAFDIPRGRYGDVADLFSPLRAEPLPFGCVDVGTLELLSKNGDRTVIELYWYGTAPVIFSVNGTPCIRAGEYKPYGNKYQFLDESLAVYGVIQELYKQAVEGRESDVLPKLLSTLKRSAGR